MERLEKPAQRRRNNPSFSSSLLDAIYRSIDDPDGGAKERNHAEGAPDPFLSPPNAKKKQSTAFAPLAAAEKQNLRRKHEHGDRYHHHHHNRRFFTSTSSSSGSSIFGGFSSSDAESSRSSNSAPLPPSPPPPPQRSSHRSIRGRFRDLRKARAGSAPSSPGARLASFLNGLFSGAGSPKEAKNAQHVTRRAEEYSACSSASSYTRSCLSKTPSTGGRSKRSVRFGSVSIGGGECDRISYKEEREYAAARAKAARRMVEELLRGMEPASDGGGAESDGSSDLFELESLAVDVRCTYRDELPVYETTHLATNRAIAHGLTY